MDKSGLLALAKEHELNLSPHSAQKILDQINNNPRSKGMIDKAKSFFHKKTANRATEVFKARVKSEVRKDSLQKLGGSSSC